MGRRFKRARAFQESPFSDEYFFRLSRCTCLPAPVLWDSSPVRASCPIPTRIQGVTTMVGPGGGLFEMFFFMVFGTGGLPTDTATLVTPEAYFKHRKIEMTLPKMLELAGT